MKKLFLYLIIVLLGVSLVDVINRVFFTPVVLNPAENTKAGAMYGFASHKEAANIVVLGASRANHHYISTQIEDSLGISVYNYGWDGRCVLYQYLCLNRAIKNGGLKIAILDLSDHQLSSEWVNDRISDLYPYYWQDDTIKRIVNQVKHKNLAPLLISSLIQYNSQYLNYIATTNSEKGYSPLPYSGVPLDTAGISFESPIHENYYSPIAIDYLEKMAEECHNNGVHFVICLSPSLSFVNEQYLSGLSRKMNVECWNYTQEMTDPVLYSDYSHLNHKGAIVFTDIIIERIKSLYFINN